MLLLPKGGLGEGRDSGDGLQCESNPSQTMIKTTHCRVLDEVSGGKKKGGGDSTTYRCSRDDG